MKRSDLFYEVIYGSDEKRPEKFKERDRVKISFASYSISSIIIEISRILNSIDRKNRLLTIDQWKDGCQHEYGLMIKSKEGVLINRFLSYYNPETKIIQVLSDLLIEISWFYE